MNKVPNGCDQQGRYPEAAEAATDVGQEQEPNFYSSQMMLEETAKFAIGVLVIHCCSFSCSLIAWGISRPDSLLTWRINPSQ